MDVKELYSMMMELIPDSPVSLRLRDPMANSIIYIFKEALLEDDDGKIILSYYRIRINGCEGTRCELVPDVVVPSGDDWLQMYTTMDGDPETQQLAGGLYVHNWEVGE